MNDMTGKIWSMSPFSASYYPMQDVQIATFLTEYTYEYRRIWIFVFNADLLFGVSMDNSLNNTNKIKMTVTPVSDDPFDDNRKLGIANKKVFITFQTDENTVYFDSIVITRREIIE